MLRSGRRGFSRWKWLSAFSRWTRRWPNSATSAATEIWISCCFLNCNQWISAEKSHTCPFPVPWGAFGVCLYLWPESWCEHFQTGILDFPVWPQSSSPGCRWRGRVNPMSERAADSSGNLHDFSASVEESIKVLLTNESKPKLSFFKIDMSLHTSACDTTTCWCWCL